MSEELFYTSAPRGLKPGTKGFCTVAMTQGISTPLADRLESLSGYRPLHPVGSPHAAGNPVLYAHWRVPHGGRTLSVLSRVCFAGLDYTQRSNKFAHHVVLASDEQPVAGPAWLMRQPGIMAEEWSGEPTLYETGRAIPAGDRPAAPCEAWQRAAGDGGWAGALAESFLADPSRAAYIVYAAGTDALELVEEAIALLPEESRWEVAFNTYFTDLPAGLACHWRFCIAGTAAAREAKRTALAAGHLLIDLTSPMPRPQESDWVQLARGGVLPAPVAAESRLADPAPAWPAPAEAPVEEEPPPAEPVAVAPADESWMPPASATVVEKPRAKKKPAGPPVAAWCIAGAGWALACILLVLRLAGPRQAAPPPPQATTAEPTVSKMEHDLAMAELQRLRNREAWIQPDTHRADLDRARDQERRQAEDRARGQLEQLRQELASAGSRSADLGRQISELKQKLAGGQKPVTPAPPTTQPAPAAANEAGPQFARLPEWKKDGASAVVMKYPAKPKRVTLVPAGKNASYDIDSRPAGAVLTRPAVSGLGRTNKEVARFRIADDGSVVFEWLIATPDEGATALLSWSVLEVTRADGTVDRFQFTEPAAVEQSPGAATCSLVAVRVPEGLEGDVRLSVRSEAAAWRVEPAGERKAVVHNASRKSSAFAVQYAPGALRQDWPALRQKALDAQQAATDALAAATTAHREATDSVSALQQLGRKGPALTEAQKRVADAAGKIREAEQQQKDAVALLSACDQPIDLRAVLSLPNGMRLCAIQIR